jgi:hypothetical protein
LIFQTQGLEIVQNKAKMNQFESYFCKVLLQKNNLLERLQHSRSQQKTDQRVLALTLKFLAQKKWFFPVKNTSQIFFDSFYLYSMQQSVQCGRYNIFKKTLIYFLTMKKLKNGPQKLLIIGPKHFFHKYGPAAQTSPELIFYIINMSQDSYVSLSVLYRPKRNRIWSLHFCKIL